MPKKKKGQKKANDSKIYSHIKEHNQDDFECIMDDEENLKKSTKKKQRFKPVSENIDSRPGITYPEILWYLISAFIQPEDIGTFAQINKATYAITKRESFWFSIYQRYCENDIKLPKHLRIEQNYRAYGLRQRVIRALYQTYDVFISRHTMQYKYECQPHSLVSRICVNSWFSKGPVNWSVYFKLRKHRENDVKCQQNRVEANPEEDNKVLQVCCKHVYHMPPLMGMTLSSVNLALSQGFTAQKLHLGFVTGHHNISKKTVPECSILLDSVVSLNVYDWWEPQYPHFEVKPPSLVKDASTPVLEVDFFDLCDEDMDL